MSGQEDIEFHWEDPDLKIDAVFRPVIDTSFSVSTLNNFEMGSIGEKPIQLDEDKENSAPHLRTTSVSETPIQTPVLMRSRPFEAGIVKASGYVYRKVLEQFLVLLCMLFNTSNT